MGRVIAIRHAQASIDGPEYDRLSPLGELQARRLGAYLASHGFVPGRCAHGRLERQRRSLELLRDSAGASWPEPEEWPELDEYPFVALARAYAHRFPTAEDVRRARAAGGLRAWLAVFERALPAWVEGQLDGADAELPAFAVFLAQIEAIEARLLQAAGGERPLVLVSSGGVLALLAQRALGAPERGFGRLNLVLRNTAWVEFRARPQGLDLIAFNHTPHLTSVADRALWTLA